MGSLLEELKRRKVFRVAAVYAVVSWVIIQVADTLFPALQLPDWTITFITVLLILGFFPVLIAAWAYERTPEGLKPDHQVHASPGRAVTSAQPINYVILVVVLVMAGIEFGDRFIDLNNGSTASGAIGSPTIARSSIFIDDPLLRASAGMRTFLDISPDGSTVFFNVFANDQQNGLRSLSLRTGDIERLGGQRRSWVSPDGRKLLATTPALIEVIDFDTGVTHFIAEYNFGVGWYSDDSLIMRNFEGMLVRMSITGEILETYGDFSDRTLGGYVQRIPDSEVILYTGGDSEPDVRAISLGTMEEKMLTQNAFAARYLQTGHLIYVRSSTLLAAPFDTDRLEFTGPESIVLQDVDSNPTNRFAAYAVSEAGRMVYLQGSENTPLLRQLLISDLEGNVTALPGQRRNMRHPRVSPDGEKVVLTVYDEAGGTDLWVYDLVRNNMGRRTLTGGASRGVWSPDSQSLVYQASSGDRGELWRINADGTGTAERIYAGNAEAEAISPDGTVLFIEGPTGGTAINSLTYRDGVWVDAPLIDSPFNEFAARISPDGRWVAYTGNETGSPEIYVQPYPNVSGGRWLISNGWGSEPVWSLTGDALFFLAQEGMLMRTVVDVERSRGEVFNYSPPEPLYPIYFNSGDPPSYAVSADGQNIIHTSGELENEQLQEQDFSTFVMIENWFEELKRASPIN